MRRPMLVCPVCRAELGDSCPRCWRTVARVRGIPDLRATEDEYLSSEEDRALADQIDAAFSEHSFDGLLNHYLELAHVPVRWRSSQVAHIKAAGGRAREWLRRIPGDGPILDLGCGSGGFLASVGRERVVVGCDIALRWLLVARKRLESEGLDDVELVCGSAERLPWADDTFSAIVAGDTIEHVGDQALTLAEAFRVLRPGGVLIMATPNRFSIGPEPHVGLLGVGFLPRSLMSRYVQWRGRGDFRAIRTHGLRGWQRLLAAGPFQGGTVEAAAIPDEDLSLMSPWKRKLARLYNSFARTRLARWVGPTFRIVATKPDVR